MADNYEPLGPLGMPPPPPPPAGPPPPPPPPPPGVGVGIAHPKPGGGSKQQAPTDLTSQQSKVKKVGGGKKKGSGKKKGKKNKSKSKSIKGTAEKKDGESVGGDDDDDDDEEEEEDPNEKKKDPNALKRKICMIITSTMIGFSFIGMILGIVMMTAIDGLP